MSSYTLLGKSPFLATSLADRPFDESLKLILNLVPTKMKFFPIHYFSTDDLITIRRKVSLFDPVLPEIVPQKLSQRFQHLDALECHSRPSHYLRRNPPRVTSRILGARKGILERAVLTATWRVCSDCRNSASLGLEPRQRDPESLVLPLHHEATNEKIKIDLSRCKSSGVALARDLSGCGFCAEQELSAFPSCFDFQGLSALCHQFAGVFHHSIDRFVVMIRIVMEKHELAHV
jgi:hypothetical protein